MTCLAQKNTCACGSLKDVRAKECRGCHVAPPAEKQCTGCGRVLPIASYYMRRSTARPLPQCKGCLASRPKSPDRQRYQRATRSRPGHYKKVAARITERRHTDPAFKLRENLRKALRQVLRRNGGIRKPSPTLELLGCGVEEFKAHIEAQWRSGMSWSNWGRNRDCWQLDHIRPVASFDLSDPAQLRACCHFSNYQPLWAPENASKRDRWAA